MKAKTLRIEQKEAHMEEVDTLLNKELSSLEERGHRIKDIRIAVGRDADQSSGLKKRFSITLLILYE